MYGERPVPDGTLTSDSDQNQPSRSTVPLGPQPPRRDRPRERDYDRRGDRNRDRPRGDHDRTRDARDPDWERESNPRDERDWDRDRHYDRRGSGEEEDSRPWSRNGYYERDRPGPEYYPPRQRDPYYGADYRAPLMPYDYRGYPPYRAQPPEFMDPNFSFNTSIHGRGYNSLPPQVSSASSKQQFKAYLEEFRVRDPPRYREWYGKYKEHLANPTRIPMPPVPGYPPPPTPFMPTPSTQQLLERRTPMPSRQRYESERERPVIVSGRSSVNDSSIFNAPESEFESLMHNDTGYDPPFDHVTETSPQRMTPRKFLTAHSIGLLTPLGQLVKVNGNAMTVEFLSLRTLMKDSPEAHELERFPGPLLKGKTFKNDVIKFCEKKIKFVEKHDQVVDRSNLILLWELLILLVRQNGAVVGSDIAELLLKKKVDAEIEDDSESEEVDNHVTNGALSISSNDAKATQKFCDLLLFGHKNGALEYAMSNNLWGHALFLASKMGERDYGQVMARFANGLGFNHPLQTLYQIMSGRQPSSVTGCGDDAFGDWKPHLAMMISNSEIRPDIACKAFITLGDTLRNKSQIYGSQFCYLMSQTLFSEDSKLGPLLGLSPDENNVLEATQMTEIYEYATSLAETNFNAGLCFLHKKFNYTKALIDYGFTFEAYSYCEVISKQLNFVDRKADSFETLRWSLLQISERLQYCEEAVSRGGQEWITDLRNSLNEVLQSESTSRRESLTSSTQAETPGDGETSASGQNVYNYVPSDPSGFQNPNYDIPVSAPVTTSYYEPATGYQDQSQQIQPSWDGQGQGQGEGASNGIGNSAYDPNIQSSSLTTPQEYVQDSGFYAGSVSQPKPYEPTNALNNNYYPSPIDPYSGYSQQPLMSNGPTSLGMPTSSSNQETINPYQPLKKKTVRFEDQEVLEEAKPSEAPEGGGAAGRSSLRMMSSGRSIIGSLDPSRTLVSRSLLKPLKLPLPKPDSFDLDDPVVDETPPETTDDEYEPQALVPRNPVQFKSTFPIDAPFGASSRPTTLLRTSKVVTTLGRTFPIDKKCCDSAEPCDEHDVSSCQSPLSSSSAPLGLPSSTGPCAGPIVNSQSQVKNDNYSQFSQPQLLPQPQLQPQPLQQQPQQPQNEKPKKDSDPPKPLKPSPKKEKSSKTSNSASSGWFGSGIFSKLPSFKGKNQMILPDDKEPTIVWDAKKGQWVNTKEDADDDAGIKGPPPKDSDLMGKMQPHMNNNISQPPQMNSGPPPASFGNQPPNSSMNPNPTWNQAESMGSNSHNGNPQFQGQGQGQGQPTWNTPQAQPQMNHGGPQGATAQAQPQLITPGQPSAFAANNKYGLPKGRSLRGGYVDVLNPGGVSGSGTKITSPMATGNGGMMPPMFIPAPTPMDPSVDSGQFSFLTQPSPAQFDGQQQQEEFDGNR